VLAAAVAVALPLSVAADAFAQAPGKDQYVPSLPTVKGGKKSKNKTTTPSTSQSGTSAEDQAVDQIANDPSLGAPATDSQKAKNAAKKAKRKAAARKKARRKAAGDKSISATPAAASGDDGDGGDDGALASVGNALTDWNDPVLPGLVVLVALLTLAASINVLMRRRRDSRS
jgi:hypothetical protein